MPALLPVVLTIQRRPSLKSVYMYPKKNLKCLQCPTAKVWYSSLLQARNRFLQIIQMCLMVLDAFLVPHTIPKWILVSHPSKPVPVHLKKSFKKEIKILQAGVLKPIHQAIPWINSFVLVEGKDKLGNLKLRICVDPTNVNKATVCKLSSMTGVQASVFRIWMA